MTVRDAVPSDLGPWSGADRYLLRATIGRGGAGQVFVATDQRTDAEVAVKMLAGSATQNPRTKERFAREIRVSSGLDVAGAVRVLDGDASGDGEAWVAMELVRGPSLREVLADGPLPLEEALRIGEQVGRTLARLHERGIAHRDVKPSNILLTPEGEPLLTDFGLVAVLTEDERRRLTTHAVGTPAYMAPEQVQEPLADHDGRLLDQFALALVVEECVTGRLVDRSALDGSVVAGSHPALGRVLAKAHHPDPAARFRRIEQLADDLERVQRGQPVRARPPGATFVAGRLVRRHRAALLSAVGALVAVGVMGWAGSLAWEHRAEGAATRRLEAMEARARALREAGRDDDARAVFDAFVALPENQGRDALAQAWLAQGRRDLELDTYHAAIDALSRAFVAAIDPSTRARTASALDVALRQAGRYRAAYTLRREYPEDVELTDELQLMLEAGDTERALQTLPADDRRAVLLRRLSMATELPARVKLTGDLDGDGLDDDMFVESGHPLALPLDGFVVRDVVEDRLMPLFDSPYWLRTTRDGGLLERLPDGSFVQRCGLDARGAVPGVVRDGAMWMLVQHRGRHIVRVDLHSCEATRPFPALDAMGSYPLSIDLADLDDDGTHEAVVSVGPPEGHGVWVLGQAAAGWEERGVARLGYVPVLRVVDTAHGPRIVANAAHFHPNPRLFPEPPHLGAPAGQHVLRLHDDGLQRVQTLRSRRVRDTREGRWVTQWVGHVDDDGQPDLVTSDGYVYLSTDDPEAPFERVPTGHDAFDFIVDIDGDGRVEIGATVDGRTLMLGVGDAPVGMTAPSSQRALDADDPALAGAQALERIGLRRFAAEAYARIGRGRSDARATDALARAAAMLGEEHPEAAAEAAEEAAARGRPAMVPVAVKRYLEVLRADAAQRVLTAHGGQLDDDDLERLQGWVDGQLRRTSLLAGRQLPDGAQSSELVRWTDQGLEVQTVTGAGRLLTVPLRQTGEVVGFVITLSTDDMEFASQLDLRLSNGAGQALSMQLVQRERGGALYRFLGEIGWGKEVPLPGWRAPTRFEVKLVELPDRAWVAVELRGDGELLERTRVPRNRGTEPQWRLDLLAPEVSGLQGQMATVTVEHLDVVGLVPDDREVAFRTLAADASLPALAAEPTGRALLHRRLRRDPLLFRELVDGLGAGEGYAVAAEAFAQLGSDAGGLLPLVAALDPVALARQSPELARIRGELLCRAGRREAGVDGLAALPLAVRCAGLRRHTECYDELPEGCED